MCQSLFCVTIRYIRPGDDLKNLKVNDETHRQMSIRAAQLGVQKNVLASALIELALAMDNNTILRFIFSVTNDVKTVYQNQDQVPKSQPDDA